MLNLPIVKFEKSCNYLTEQLTLQNNNKQLILDIISNIGLILNDSEEKFEQYDNILETANEFLKTISSNITSIEQLNLEIKNITAELTELLSEQSKASKTKEFYIAAFSNIKHNIIVYSKKFQEMENKLTIDNNKFNEFINENNFKYNFVSLDNSTNTYTFTGFSINDTEELSTNNDDSEKVNDETLENKTNEEILETTTIEENTEVPVSSVEEVIENEETVPDTTLENNNPNINKIDELTNEFKSLLINLSETNISDATESVVSLFKEMLPQNSTASFEDFLDLGKTKKDENSIEEVINLDEENNSNSFDAELIFDNFIIETQEKIITLEHNAITYEYLEELDENEKTEPEETTVTSPNVTDISTTTIEENLEDSLTDNDLLEALLETEEVEETLENSEEIFIEDVADVEDTTVVEEILENTFNISESLTEDIVKDSSENVIEDTTEEITNEVIDKLDENDSNTEISLVPNEEIYFDDIELLNNIILSENTNTSDDDTNNSLTDIDIDIDIDSDIVENLIEENIDLDIDEDSILADIDLLEDEIELIDSAKLEEPTTEELETTVATIEDFFKKDDLKDKGMSKKDFEIKISNIENATEDNKTLVISERLQKIYLPYKVSELVNYVESYPGSYKSLKDVVEQEFVLPFDYFRKHPSKSRFTEAYNLLKNREGRNFMKSVSYAFRLLRKNNLNPAIIASCKTQHELDSYLYYLDSDNLNNFKFFDIIYEVNPI